MKRSLLTFTLLVPGVALAQNIFPFAHMPTQQLYSKVQRMAEETNILRNIHQVEARGLKQKTPTVQPWSGSYWPLIQGQIANTYHGKSQWDLFNIGDYFKWQNNVESFEKRKAEKLSRVYDLSEAELALMAPSEKYDLLLGDTSFDLTNRIWKYVGDYGSMGGNAYVRNLVLPAGYRLPENDDKIQSWEGICHGWALAATGSPRPEKAVEFTLPNGKKLPFYPTDIKALISLMYANSNVQNNVKMEGYRCNVASPLRDRSGRFIDFDPNEQSGEGFQEQCADVHPAVWFLSVINMTGIQGRSLVVDIDANATVNNHPFAGYRLRWFHPESGRDFPTLARAVLPRSQYEQDPFRAARNPEAVSIVGVEMDMVVTDWTWPTERKTDAAPNDQMKTRTMIMDLELNANGDVVGGQWRATRDPREWRTLRPETRRHSSTYQPDFFWALPKNYQTYFRGNSTLPAWNTLTTAPARWAQAAKAGHEGAVRRHNDTCTVVSLENGSSTSVPCSYEQSRPMPLIDLVQRLLQLSRQ